MTSEVFGQMTARYPDRTRRQQQIGCSGLFANALLTEGVPVLRVRVLAAIAEVEAAIGHVVGVVAVAVALSAIQYTF